MYIHLGDGVNIRSKDITAIMDYKLLLSPTSADYLRQKREQGELVELEKDPDEKRSFVITTDKIYVSSLSTAALRKRVQMPWELEDELTSK